MTRTARRRGPAAPAPTAPPAAPTAPTGWDSAAPVEPGSFRERVHSKPGRALAWRIGVFVAGLLFVLLGLALTVLPGPLTIPPVLLGLWVWSTEFDWARRVFATFARKGRDAWKHARQHPVSSAAVTVGGLAAAAPGVLGRRPLRPRRPGEVRARPLTRPLATDRRPNRGIAQAAPCGKKSPAGRRRDGEAMGDEGDSGAGETEETRARPTRSGSTAS